MSRQSHASQTVTQVILDGDLEGLSMVFAYRDRFLETLLERVRERLQRAGAERRPQGRYWYWDLEQADLSGEVV